MAETHVITALVRKRAQVAGEIETVRARLERLIGALETLDGAILVFDPEYVVAGIRPIAYRLQDKGRAPRGELPRMLLDLIREAGEPMTAPQIVGLVMQKKGLDQSDQRAVRHMTVTVNAALRRHRKKGAIRSWDGPGVHLLWGVATP